METDDTQMAGHDGAARRIGEVIEGRYRILDVVGRGGMGTVYRAEHIAIHRPVALKLIHPELGASPDFAKRFEREAVAMGRLDHPCCIAVSDFGKLDDGALYLVMELLSGESLASALAREGRFSVERALRITRHVLRGLRHAHRAEVVHRDLKPENVFLAEHEEDPEFAKILDFGIAKLVGPEDGGGSDKLTQTGFAVGTPKYIAPELAFGDTVTPQADLYSTAVIAFEMLTGSPPFVADDPTSVLTMHAGKPVPAMSEVAPEQSVPEPVEALIRAGLAKRRADRIASADEFLARIDELLVSLFGAAPGASRASMPPGTVGPAPPGTPPLAAPPSNPAGEPPGAAQPPPPGAPPSESWAGGVPPGPAPLPAPAPETPPPGAAPFPAAPPRADSFPPQGERGDARPPEQGTAIVQAPERMSWRGPAKLLGAIVAASVVVGVAASDCRSRDEMYRDYTERLRDGETCEERREAVHKLEALGDERAIEPLRRARRRMRGGVLGLGADNQNACLKRDAERAIRHLRGD